MTDRDGDFGVFLAGFIIGGMVGSIIALLLAPQSGEETRTIIRDRSIELKDKAVEAAEAARVKAEAAAVDARTRADELAKLTQEKAAGLMKKIGSVVPPKEIAGSNESSDVTVEG
jgi:gas vesicle protein